MPFLLFDRVPRNVEIARAEKIERVIVEIPSGNIHMQRACRQLGFRMVYELT